MRNSASFGFLLLLSTFCVKANAGAIGIVSDGPPGFMAEGDIVLEVSSRIDELIPYFQRYTGDLLVCRGDGWFAEASSEFRDGVKHGASAVCGAETKKQAIELALEGCQEMTPMPCSINYVKYDNDRISFLSHHTIKPNGYGGFIYEDKSNGAQYLCCHGQYSGLDQAPVSPATKHSSNSVSDIRSQQTKREYELTEAWQAFVDDVVKRGSIISFGPESPESGSGVFVFVRNDSFSRQMIANAQAYIDAGLTLHLLPVPVGETSDEDVIKILCSEEPSQTILHMARTGQINGTAVPCGKSGFSNKSLNEQHSPRGIIAHPHIFFPRAGVEIVGLLPPEQLQEYAH